MENKLFDTAATLPVRPSRQRDERVRVFQRQLYLKAKQDPGFKAHSLYDKVSDCDVLAEAYERVCRGQSQQGGAGVDGVTIEAIEAGGRDHFLRELQQQLQRGSYRSQAVRRVFIPKGKGGERRPLGIPTIADRVVQMAVKMVIEPLFEADFIEGSYGFRPKRSAQDAVRAIRSNIHAAGRRAVCA